MASYYIATTGNDSTGNGTLGNPWLTLSKAYSSSTGGDTINVAAGSYTWASASMTQRTITGPTIAVGGTLPTAVFNGAAAAVSWALSGGGSMTLNNLRFTNATNPNSSTAIFFSNTGTLVLTFNNCCIDTCTIVSNSSGPGGGVFSMTTVTVAFNNGLIANITGLAGFTGTQCLVARMNSSAINYTFTNSTIRLNDSGANRIQAIFNNFNNAPTFTNCIIQNDGGTLGWESGGSTSVTWTYTNHFGFTNATAGTGNISADSLFVDPNNLNCSLRPTSPCIDAGVIV